MLAACGGVAVCAASFSFVLREGKNGTAFWHYAVEDGTRASLTVCLGGGEELPRRWIRIQIPVERKTRMYKYRVYLQKKKYIKTKR